VKYALMKELRSDYPIPLMCWAFAVLPSGYYAWLRRKPSKYAQEAMRLEVEVRAAHPRTRKTYGPQRLQADLAEQGVKASVHRIKCLRKQLGLRGKQRRKFKATTQSHPGLPVAENLPRIFAAS
jgi:putative transposase